MKFKKIILFAFLLIVWLVSCKPRTDKNAVGSGSNEPTQKTGIKNTSQSVQQSDTANRIAPITSLPFGPAAIVQYKFPDDGWADPMGGPVPKIDKKHQEEFKKIRFGPFNYSKSVRAPLIKHVIFVNVWTDSLITTHDEHYDTDFKYRLPNFGPYECYYQYHTDSLASLVKAKYNTQYDGFGNLVLIDTLTGDAKILNIYSSFEYGEEGGGHYYRYFFIDKEKNIDIFTAGGEEGSGSLKKVQVINVQSDGTISFKNIK
ncbi:hypothetical protein HDF18_17125 [Mucilaginibacter sp. X5P1]|uniref:hypothetical protein n=1 Tax=Mucilaginibacter sp. X5P1 TaxID=2723088 RepID=UPI0016223CAB|nr:hypothetical protein [Mucilaginibacter sp. X5P1]MBB6139359.1 hypothetical protein [Mucilaginibacter sp. X5P1]